MIYTQRFCSRTYWSTTAPLVWREGFTGLMVPSDAPGAANSRHLISVRSLYMCSAVVTVQQVHFWAVLRAHPDLEADTLPLPSPCPQHLRAPSLRAGCLLRGGLLCAPRLDPHRMGPDSPSFSLIRTCCLGHLLWSEGGCSVAQIGEVTVS